MPLIAVAMHLVQDLTLPVIQSQLGYGLVANELDEHIKAGFVPVNGSGAQPSNLFLL
jgi:hypothetical protein